MPRQPTQAEIWATNANLTTRCDKCTLEMNADRNYGTFPNALTLKMSGGYGEFVDTINPDSKEFEFTLCHKCAHKLMKTFFSQWEFSHWHPRTAEKFCDGWTYSNGGEE
jgi:hypothetical protein